MAKWANMSEVNNILGKALELCQDELNPSFYGGARLMLDKINEMAEEVADTPQTDCLTCRYNSDEWDSPKCDSCSKADSNYEPQTDCGWK